MHVFEWLEIEPQTIEHHKVHRFLDFKTRSALYQAENQDKIEGLSVFCMNEGTKHRITGASRFGDVWLSRDLDRIYGYDVRVDIEDCTGFSFIDTRDIPAEKGFQDGD